MRMHLAAALLAAGGLLVGSLCTGSAHAQNRPAAFTDAAEAGADFALQGEYAGVIFGPGEGNQYAGLQVVALGNGRFEAVQYRGGLPGAGWDGQWKARFEGRASGGRLELKGAKNRWTIADGSAALFSEQNQELGRLGHVERTSPTMGLGAPAGAVVLFQNGTANESELAKFKVSPEGLLLPEVLTRMPVAAFRLHLEFRTPFMPTATGQARGNSGVYIQRRYEVQILDSFGLEGAENECGGLYRQTRPAVNMALPPLSWQTYDIWFTPAQFAADGKTKLANARITVLHNGVAIHWQREITAKTGGGRPEGPEPLPLQLQDHGNPVAFRNFWLVPAGTSYTAATSSQGFASRGLLGRWRRCR
jgi:hypothetical protein